MYEYNKTQEVTTDLLGFYCIFENDKKHIIIYHNENSSLCPPHFFFYSSDLQSDRQTYRFASYEWKMFAIAVSLTASSFLGVVWRTGDRGAEQCAGLSDSGYRKSD